MNSKYIIIAVSLVASFFLFLQTSSIALEHDIWTPQEVAFKCGDYPREYITTTSTGSKYCKTNRQIDFDVIGGPLYAGGDGSGRPFTVRHFYEDGAREECSAPLIPPFYRNCTIASPGRYAAPHLIKMSPCTSKSQDGIIQAYNKGQPGWKLGYNLIDAVGLVFKDISSGGNRFLSELSIPHFKVVFGDGHEKIIRFCSATDVHTQPKLISADGAKGIDIIRWSFSKQFDSGLLMINYDFVIRYLPVTNCEAQSNPCLRLIPKMSFNWKTTLTTCKNLVDSNRENRCNYQNV
jgi:hypothetical protein